LKYLIALFKMVIGREKSGVSAVLRVGGTICLRGFLSCHEEIVSVSGAGPETTGNKGTGT